MMDLINDYLLEKTCELTKIIEVVLKAKYPWSESHIINRSEKDKLLKDISRMYVSKFMRLCGRMRRGLRAKITSFLSKELFMEKNIKTHLPKIAENSIKRADDAGESLVEIRNINLRDQTIRKVFRMNRNSLKMWKCKLKRRLENLRIVKAYFRIADIKSAQPENAIGIYKKILKKENRRSNILKSKQEYDCNNLIRCINVAIKGKKHFHEIFVDSFRAKKKKTTRVRLSKILKHLFYKKLFTLKKEACKTPLKKSCFLKCITKQEGQRQIDNLLSTKGITSIPGRVLNMLYVYNEVLENLTNSKHRRLSARCVKALIPYQNEQDLSSVCRRIESLNLPPRDLNLLSSFRKRVSRAIRSYFRYRHKQYLGKTKKEEMKKLQTCIEELMKCRGYSDLHSSVLNDFVSDIISTLKDIGRQNVSVKKLSLYLKLIGKFKYLNRIRTSGTSNTPNEKAATKIKDIRHKLSQLYDKNKIENKMLNIIISHLKTYISCRPLTKSRRKHVDTNKKVKWNIQKSLYVIEDPDLKAFYDFLVDITMPPHTARWMLRKRILQHGEILKKCGHTFDEETSAMTIAKLEIPEEKIVRPLYRPTPNSGINQEKEKPTEETTCIIQELNNEIEWTSEEIKPIAQSVGLGLICKQGISKVQVNPIKREKKDKIQEINVNKVYQFKSCLYRGQYSNVNRYHSRIFDKDVAIKSISKVRMPRELLIKFLPRAFLVIKRLNHPNIIKFYEAFENGVKLYLVMELAEQGSLTSYIKNRGRLDSVVYKKFFAQIVDAYYYCLEQKVYHRKICTDNILVTKSNDVKLCDFLYAKEANGRTDLSETYCGVHAFTAPEVLSCTPYCPFQADIWSIGVVVYAMVYGVLPFNPCSYKDIMQQVKCKVRFRRYPDTPYQVINLMRKMIAPIKYRIDMIGLLNDPWLFEKKEEKISRMVMENVKPWEDMSKRILDIKQQLQEKIKQHLYDFSTDSEFEKLQKKRAKRKDIIPEKMEWLFQLYT